jgi:Carboxypeptidase regulatory-like domain
MMLPLATRGNAGENRFAIRALICGILLTALPIAAHAQAYAGSVTGTITDTSGAAIAGASVTIVNTATNETATGKTSNQGVYSFPQLPVGKYRLTVEQTGFKQFIARDIEVHVSTPTVVDAKLEVGKVTETVVVEANPVEVQTNSASLGYIVQGTQVRELPLNGENFVQLTQLSPGVSPANTFNGVDKGLAGGVDFSVNGNPYTNNLFLVDGVNNNDVGSNRTILVYPAIDTISEFKMLTNAYGPEYGQASGSIISITTKSGTNQWHGGVFYAGRNAALDANDWFSNHNDTGKAPLVRNDWGYNISGPIIKNKLFIWWNQEWNRQTQGTSEAACVPTAAERSGDFSQGVSCGASVPNIPIAFQSPTNKNIIANPNPVGLLYAQFYPLPNIPTQGNGNNWAQDIANKQNWSEWNVRGDYDITSKERVTFRWTQDSWTNPAPNPGTFWGDAIFPVVAANWSQPSKSVMGKLSSTITSSMVNDVEFGYGNNAIITSLGGTNPGLVSQINAVLPTEWPSSLKQSPALPQTPWGGLQPYGSTQTIWNISPYSNHEDLYTIQDNLTKVHGNHTFKFGAFYSWNDKVEDNNGGTDQPVINVADGNVVVGPGAAGARTGNQLANLLIPGTGATPQQFATSENSINATAYVHWHDFEFYAGDTWKMRRNLTLSYGFRWSFFREPYASDNHWASFSLSDYNPALPPQDACNGVVIVPGTTPCANQQAFLATLGVNLPLSAGTPGVNRALVNNNDHDIAPRVGIAWDLFGDGKSAVRVGVGQFYQRELVGLDEGLARTAPFVINATVNRPLNSTVPLAGPAVSPNAAKSPRGVTPNSWQWNVSFEQQLARAVTLQMSYVGNAGIHLTSMMDLNQVPAAYWPEGSFLSGQSLNALRPAGNFGMIGEFARQGHSDYNALQVLFKAQTGNYSIFQASYTWSHSIGNVDLDNSSGSVNQEAWLNNADPNLDRGNSNINRPQIFVANEVYFLPKFPGKSEVVQQTIGGWQLSSIVTIENGNSVSVFSNGASGINGSSLSALLGSGFNQPQRPIATGVGCNSGTPGQPADQIFNPAAFSFVGYNLGYIPSNLASRGVCQGPGNVNFDLQFAKIWQVGERVRIKFGMDFFNIFNHANFSGNGLANGFSASNLICGNTACSPTNNLVTGQTSGNNNTFGQATQVHPGRTLQYGMKISF